MELRHLTYFVAVAEEKHFGRAAQRLRMAQPPLSQQIKSLERSLEVKLLERTTRRVDLTPAGEVLLERARILLAEVETLSQDLRRIHAGAQGILRLGSTGSAAYDVLPRIVREARKQLPGVELELTGENLTPAMAQALEEHRLDLALIRLPVATTELELEVLQSDEITAALPADHELAGRAVVDLADLRGQPMVGYPPSSAISGVVTGLCREAGFRPRVEQVVKETSTMVSIVAGGGGLALVPEPVAALGTAGVVFRPIVGRPQVDLAIAWRRDDDRPLLQALLDVVRACTGPQLSEDQEGAE